MTRRHVTFRTALPAVLLSAVATVAGFAAPAAAGTADGASPHRTTSTAPSGSTSASGSAASPQPHHPESACNSGEFCAWQEEFYDGKLQRFDLRNTQTEQCVTLDNEMEAHSFATRMERHVTVYQDDKCATQADFSTYPGPGTYVPQAPYVVRAIQVWE
ncbi:peptidase inhibitor family I36 protein [Prauserella sediminis]|nr:peptidase inhibitor family I36 protein [Prauserella sediminis]